MRLLLYNFLVFAVAGAPVFALEVLRWRVPFIERHIGWISFGLAIGIFVGVYGFLLPWLGLVPNRHRRYGI